MNMHWPILLQPLFGIGGHQGGGLASGAGEGGKSSVASCTEGGAQRGAKGWMGGESWERPVTSFDRGHIHTVAHPTPSSDLKTPRTQVLPDVQPAPTAMPTTAVFHVENTVPSSTNGPNTEDIVGKEIEVELGYG